MAYSTIPKPSVHFNTVLYVGNGTAIASGGKTVTGVGFQPDFVWGKARSGTDAVDNHELTDAVRGVTKYLKCNNNSAETTSAESLTSFTNDGFILGNNGQMNRNGNNCVAWNWKAGTTSGQATNQYSTITPSGISFNATSGFSIVKYTGNGTGGAGVPHGLNAKPSMIFVKKTSGATDWIVYSQPNLNISNATKYLKLNETDAEATSSTMWNGYQADTTNFSLGTNSYVNNNGDTYVAYVFVGKKGFSKIGSYEGNGNADGTFVYTGFKPALVIIKRLTAGHDWYMNTAKINGFNVQNDFLAPNTNAAEVVNNTAQPIDIVSNGFKCRGTGGGNNENGVSYIYLAFAEAPLVANSGTNGVPATAR